MTNDSADIELVRAKLNSETAKIHWKELQKFFAAGKVLYVEPELDLIDVAFALHRDNAELVQQWLITSSIYAVSDTQAKDWLRADSTLWTTVVKPWVLVQIPD